LRKCLINGFDVLLCRWKVTEVSEEISKLPPQIQERLLRLQQLQQTLQTILAQKQQVELELTEIEQALSELQKIADDTTIYKAIGSLLVKAEKPKVTADLDERKELLNVRVQVLGKQEERLRGQLKDLQTKLQKELSPISPS
jgi:prefoldin beta subunit